MKNRVAFGVACFLFCFSFCAQAQTINTIGGNGVAGFGGDGGPATATIAEINMPDEIAIDAAGNIFIADYGNYRIRKISSSGIITTFAGTGVSTYSGDGGPATAAQFDYVNGIAVDPLGNVYVSNGWSAVRKINTSGIITLFAGSSMVGGFFSGDGGPATAALLCDPEGIAADAAGNVYICEIGNRRVRKVDALGIITTFAGNGTIGYSGDGGPATNAQLGPWSIALDNRGNMFISDANSVIRKVDPSGIISTYAGNGTGGYGGDWGPATNAELDGPRGIAIDTAGNLFISVFARIRKVNKSGIITTIAGNGIAGFAGDGGPATACEFAGDFNGLALNWGCGEYIYASDGGNNRIRKVLLKYTPAFNVGHTYNLLLCKDTGTVNISPLLAATDSDAGQVETWSMITPPVHGTAITSYSTTSTGGLLTPTGLSYTPVTGYIGDDTFKVTVYDCGVMADTITVYVMKDTLPVAGTITGMDTVCKTESIMLSDNAVGGVWTSTNVSASIASGIVSGLVPGADTIHYIVANACGSDTAAHVVNVKDCVSGVTSPTFSKASGQAVAVYPNPAATILNIEAANKINQIKISNLLGQTVFATACDTKQMQVDVVNLPAGVYFIKINGSEVEKFVKQ